MSAGAAMEIIPAGNLEAPSAELRTSVSPICTSSIQLPDLPSVPAPFPDNFFPPSVASPSILVSCTTTSPAAHTSSASLEPSTTSEPFFSSSIAVSSTSSSLPKDSSVLGFSLAPEHALTSSIESSSFSPPFTSSSSVSPATFSYAGMMQALSGSCSRDIGHGPPGCTLSPEVKCIPSTLSDTSPVTMRQISTSAVIPTLPSSLSPMGSLSSVEISPSGMSIDSLSAVLRTTSSPTDSPSIQPPAIASNSSALPQPSPCVPPCPATPTDSPKGLFGPVVVSISRSESTTSEEGHPVVNVPQPSPLAPSVSFVAVSAGLSGEQERTSLETSTTVPTGNIATSTTLPPTKISHCITPEFSATLKSPPYETSNGDLVSRGSDAVDCSPSPSNHFVIIPSGLGNISPSSLNVRSVKEEQAANSGPPCVPSPEAFPRRPARGGQKGEGWPYAPQGWPSQDDKWLWKVGKRLHHNGYFRDRFLGLPRGLCKGRKVTEFASKKSIVAYLKKNFPDVNVENFFKSFQWRVPYNNFRNSHAQGATVVTMKANTLKRQRPAEEDKVVQRAAKKFKEECRAGNSKCGLETGNSFLVGDEVALECDICCTEPRFCRECKCILCCQVILLEGGECFFVRCLQKPSGNGICGHAAHLECALRSSRAGVVKERGLDMEYQCRRCDKKTDLRDLVTHLIEMVGSTDDSELAEHSLCLALKVMKGTEHGGSGARALESLLQTALKKVQTGVGVREVFNDLRDQGAAAEAAKQHNLGRASALLEDASQQPEASLDQWLLSSGSPSSHRSPTTPSSFTSPPVKSNPSVNSGQLNGANAIDGVGKLKKSLTTGHHMDPQTSVDVYSNSNHKHSHVTDKSMMITAGPARASHRIRSGSSHITGHQTNCDSNTPRTTENQILESGSRDDNTKSSKKAQNDQRSPASSGLHREDSGELCRSCGTGRCHTSIALDAISGRKKDSGAKKLLQSTMIHRHEQGDSDKCEHIIVQESDTGANLRDLSNQSFSANGSGLTVMGTPLELLNSECQEDVLVALQKLRKAQDAEFECAKQCLNAQREYTLKQYELLEIVRCKFSEQSTPTTLLAFDDLMLSLTKQLTKATEERRKFKSMLKIANGFGSVSKDDLNQFYRWPVEKC